MFLVCFIELCSFLYDISFIFVVVFVVFVVVFVVFVVVLCDFFLRTNEDGSDLNKTNLPSKKSIHLTFIKKKKKKIDFMTVR